MKNKWLFVGIAVVVIIAGILAFNGRGTNVNQPNTPAAPVAPTPSTAGTIQVPGGPKIKVVFNGPPELKVNWEKLGMAGFQLQLIGTMTNISKQAVKFSEIAFLLDNQQLDYIPGQTISPGGQIKITKGFPGDYENAKVLEIKIKGFEVVGGSTTTPKPTTMEPTTMEPTTTPSTETVFTEMPKSLQSPGEVVAAFWFLLSNGKYDKAAELLTKDYLQLMESKGGLERAKETFQGRQIKRIEFAGITIDTEGRKASVYDATIYFTNGDKEAGGSVPLIREGGVWKIEN
jgi:hypothetical protein